MATEREIYENYLGQNLAHHQAVCRGEYCAACDELMPTPPWDRGLRLCRRCWPDQSARWHHLHIAIAWNPVDAWVLCICWPTPQRTGPAVSYWLLLHDRAECLAVLDRYVCDRSARAALEKQRDRSGHQAVAIFVTDRRLAALAEATLRDARTGYDKLKSRTADRQR